MNQEKMSEVTKKMYRWRTTSFSFSIWWNKNLKSFPKNSFLSAKPYNTHQNVSHGVQYPNLLRNIYLVQLIIHLELLAWVKVWPSPNLDYDFGTSNNLVFLHSMVLFKMSITDQRSHNHWKLLMACSGVSWHFWRTW